MTDHRWYRRTTWSPDDQRDFYARLKRSRSSFHKAQYLRIQALHLERDAEPPLPDAALNLLNELLTDYPDLSQLASAYWQKSSCCRTTGRYAEALEALQAALDAERSRPSVTTTAYLDYGELVLQQNWSALYENALSLLGERVQDEPFPILRFRSRVAAAMLCERLGRPLEAKEAAKAALAAAAATESPFRYHRNLGLVMSLGLGTERWLRELAAG